MLFFKSNGKCRIPNNNHITKMLTKCLMEEIIHVTKSALTVARYNVFFYIVSPAMQFLFTLMKGEPDTKTFK